MNILSPAYQADAVTDWEAFNKAPFTAYSSRRTPYTRWLPYGMPKLGKYQRLLTTAFFLYPDRAHVKFYKHYFI